MLLVTFRSIADSAVLLGLSLLSELLTCAVMFKLLHGYKKYGDGTLPDGNFGFTQKDLQGWYESIGEEGCQTYIKATEWDLIPFVLSYIMFIGSGLVYASKRAGWNDTIAYIVVITLVSDIVETAIILRGCYVYPDSLEPLWLYQIASMANQAKWISFVGATSLIPVLLVLGSITKNGNKTHAK